MKHNELFLNVSTRIESVIEQHYRTCAGLPSAVIIAAIGTRRHARAVANGVATRDEPYVGSVCRGRGLEVRTLRSKSIAAKVMSIIDDDQDAIAFVIDNGRAIVSPGSACLRKTLEEHLEAQSRAKIIRRVMG